MEVQHVKPTQDAERMPDLPSDEDARQFCDAHGLWPLVTAAVALARDCFPNIERLALEHRRDPENGAEWVTLKVTTRATTEVAFAASLRYTQLWTERVPLPERYQLLFSYRTV